MILLLHSFFKVNKQFQKKLLPQKRLPLQKKLLLQKRLPPPKKLPQRKLQLKKLTQKKLQLKRPPLQKKLLPLRKPLKLPKKLLKKLLKKVKLPKLNQLKKQLQRKHLQKKHLLMKSLQMRIPFQQRKHLLRKSLPQKTSQPEKQEKNRLLPMPGRKTHVRTVYLKKNSTKKRIRESCLTSLTGCSDQTKHLKSTLRVYSINYQYT